MIEKIKQVLMDKKIVEYKISEKSIESIELFFVKKNLDMNRAKNVQHYMVTVYVDFEEDRKKLKGSMETNIYPTMTEAEIDKAIEDALFAARFVRNDFYPLAKANPYVNPIQVSNMSEQSLSYWMNEITKAIYESDEYEKGCINSCEIFLNKTFTRIINSEGIDVNLIDYDCMVEFITTWKETNEEIELYKSLHFSEFDKQYLVQVVNEMMMIAKEKAIAKETPAIGKSCVLLTKEAVKEIFYYYYAKSSAASVYNEGSTWKLGDCIQGEGVKGDYITLGLNPFMRNSTFSSYFDEDGYLTKAVNIIEEGVLKRYHANTRYAYYLNVEPTGSISNMVVSGGSKSLSDLKNEPYLEISAFSDFTVDEITGDFGGEIRLAWYFDGQLTIPTTGGSITGNINELHKEIYLSKELQKDNNFEGPLAISLLNVTVTGIEKRKE